MRNNKLYLISFIEGACVMAAEICGAKILSPFFGSSLYVWSAVMAITLGGLAAGYFAGGKLSKRQNKEITLFYIFMLASCCLCFMPFIAEAFPALATGLPFIPSVIISVFLLLFPVMVCMGSSSPVLISILTVNAGDSGINSGRIYAISTLGGIVATFLCGFYLIPAVGIRLTLIYFAIPMALAGILLINKSQKSKILFLVAPVLLATMSFSMNKVHPDVIYQTDGILGKLEIRDELPLSGGTFKIRKLLINTIVQTEMNLGNYHSVSDYIHLLEKNSAYFPKGKALVLGLGGGLTANLFQQQHYQVTGVEFDQRIIDMAKTYFFLNDSIKTVCDDARYFINRGNGKYNVILFDLFKAEEQPSYVITGESLEKLKLMLDKDGVILINTHGYLDGEKGKGTQCLLSTLRQAGFHLKICVTGEQEDYRNILIVAGVKPITASLHNEVYPLIISNSGLINKDDKPVLEKLNAEANRAWRNNYIHNYILRKNQ